MPVKEIPKNKRYRRAQMREIVTSQPAENGTNVQIVDNVFQGWSRQGVVRYNKLREKVKIIDNMYLVLSAIRETWNCLRI